ncbi:hypothetical protein XENORESO_018583 [Xenotaenia resolanae]|uniref:Uncharacterized protein n=1 Tax=Xenotaenia resolanae TaxID=208358 RepID=A0ABV0WMW0_9TELE
MHRCCKREISEGEEKETRRKEERRRKPVGGVKRGVGGDWTCCRRKKESESCFGEHFQNSCPADVPVVRSVAPRGGYRRQDSVNKPQEQHCSIHTHKDTHFTLRRGGISDEDSDLAIQTTEKSVHLLKIPSPDWRAIVRSMQQLFLESCKWRVFLRM